MSDRPSPSRAALGADDSEEADFSMDADPDEPRVAQPSGIAIPAEPAAKEARKGFFARLRGERPPASVAGGMPATPIPPLEPGWREIETTPIREAITFVRIAYHDDRHEYRYEVIEPPLTEDEAAVSRFLRQTFVRTLDVNLDDLEKLGRSEYLRRELGRLIHLYGLKLSEDGRARVLYYLERDFLGMGVIDVLMHDPQIEDVSCDGPGIPIFIYHRRFEAIRSNITFADHETLDGFVMELVQRSGRTISVAEPLVDATLPDGSRLQASLAKQITTRGSTFTIRKFREDPLTPIDLLALGTMSADMLAYLWLAVENGASAIICGGTASGKTTTLNALSLFIPAQLKIVSIEDTREINIPHDNWIPGVTRGGAENGGDAKTGTVDMFDLLRAALRQRPEYLIVGEIRGREAYVLFQAMATGHTVYSTMHADSAPSAVYRLESKPLEVPRIMLNALDIIVIQGQIRIAGKRSRRIREIVEIAGIDPRSGELLTNRAFAWDPAKDAFFASSKSHVLDGIATELSLSRDALIAELHNRAAVLQWLLDTKQRDLAAVWRVIARYGADKRQVLIEAGVIDPARSP